METAPKRIGLEDMDPSKYMSFGSLYIIGVDSLMFPLDTIKTIIMAERVSFINKSKKAKQSLLKMTLKIAKREGIARFWRGIIPSTIGNFPGQSSYYLAYEATQMVISRWIPDEKTELARFSKGFLSGMSAEIAGGLFYVPADIVAQRLQIQDTKGFGHNCRLYKGPWDVVKRIYRWDGIKGLYRGYGAYVTAYAPGSAIQWGSYEASKIWMFKVLSKLEQQKYIPDQIPGKEQYVNALSAGIAGICAVASNNPLEILRIRTQLLESNSKKDAQIIKGGYFSLASSIYKEEGWSAFYRGLKIRLLVTVPSAVVALSGYELIKQYSTL